MTSWSQLQNVQHMLGTDRVITFGPVIDAATGNFVDLTNAHASWRMARKATGGDIFIRKTDLNGITFTSVMLYGDVQWSVNVTLVPADTASLLPSLSPARYYHELWITDQFNKVTPFASGFFDLVPSINAQA
jgi:hypothetical protein